MQNMFSRPIYVMPKPAGALCNLECEYCYYLEKNGLYSGDMPHTMSDATLELFIKQYIEAQTCDDVLFTWHGGEPTLRPIEFYRRAMELQEKYAMGKKISNSIQTNATMLDDRWCRFFSENNWLVGVSIDGPQRFHDEYRRAKGGKPTFASVLKGIRLLQKYRVEWNAMAVVNEYNADYPEEVYRFFKNIGCRYIQFTPVVERKNGEVTDFSVTPEQWGAFLCGVFDEWIKADIGKIFVQTFDATLANWVGINPGTCVLSNRCGHAAVMEWNGDLYCCDHFVYPEFRLGNIHQSHIIDMMQSDSQTQFAEVKTGNLPPECLECEWKFACYGECPKNRFALSKDGTPRLNYLCEGYKRFFRHSAPAMERMSRMLKSQSGATPQ